MLILAAATLFGLAWRVLWLVPPRRLPESMTGPPAGPARHAAVDAMPIEQPAEPDLLDGPQGTPRTGAVPTLSPHLQ